MMTAAVDLKDQQVMEEDVGDSTTAEANAGDTWAPSNEDNFKVVIRVRPPLQRELRGSALRPYQCTTQVEGTGRLVTLSENLPAVQGTATTIDPGLLYATYRFTFDHVYDQESSQEEVYGHTAQQVVLSILQGYNAAIIAYGQTGTGKTYTMEGALEGPERGIIPRTVEDIFTHIVNDPEPTSKYLVRASYLQIYNEVISDLLKPDRTNLVIREDRRRGVFVEGLSEWVVRSPAEVHQLMEMGQAIRATGATKLNEVSSRSHAVCIIIVEKCITVGGAADPAVVWSRAGVLASQSAGAAPTSYNIKVGKLSLVDLAGSERVHVTGAVGKRLEESKKINASLSALGNVIAALTDRRGERTHIPYRDSKLTRILEDSLGGNCRTTMICTITPALDAFQESLSTLKFANRAKTIKNAAHVNEDLDQRTLLRKYERELRKLRAELQKRSKSLVDKRALLEAEEQTRRAEADKLAVLTALEKRSRELMKEKEEKLALEAKIAAMQSQLLVGGVALGVSGGGGQGGRMSTSGAVRGTPMHSGTNSNLEEMPVFKQLLQREQRRIRSEYEARLRELEGERQAVEEDRQQVDRYKQLLLKQRDIMIALTARLNERDEQIMALQEELETCDRQQRQLEDALDNRTADLHAFRKAAAEAASQGGTALASLLNKWGSTGLATGGPTTPSHGVSSSGQANTVKAAGGDKDVPVELSRAMLSLTTGSTPAPADAVVHVTSIPSTLGDMDGGGNQQQLTGIVAALQADNQRLVAQLAAVKLQQQQAAQAPLIRTSSDRDQSQDGGSSSSRDQAELVDSLMLACESAQRERNALQQILDTRVRRMMTELLGEAGHTTSSAVLKPGALQAPDSKGPQQQRLMSKLQALDSVLNKVVAAIKAAPPIIPPDLATQL